MQEERERATTSLLGIHLIRIGSVTFVPLHPILNYTSTFPEIFVAFNSEFSITKEANNVLVLVKI